jgi:hypothetical protein
MPMSTLTTFMVWPPLRATAESDLLRCMAIVSWFAGPIASEILVPVLDLPVGSGPSVPNFVSGAALADIGKVRLISTDESEAAMSSKSVVLLVRQREAFHQLLLTNARPMHGSLPLEHVPVDPNKAKGPTYYYIGVPESDIQDAYYAVCLTYWATGGPDSKLLADSRTQLLGIREKAGSIGRVAMFGTGPSLGEAIDRDHSQSLNIICNTIIKNRSLVSKLSPKILVASDAHFHFSYHRYSARFLADLVNFLEHSDAAFYTFDKFAVFLRRRLPSIADRVFGIPAGRQTYGFDFDNDFRLYPGDSVLNMFLLPLASFLGKELLLNGFTGRAPSDNYFWSHSELHQYTDRMEDVRNAHPAFFRNRDYGGYASNVDSEISLRVDAARSAGKLVRSETTSFYSAFAK